MTDHPNEADLVRWSEALAEVERLRTDVPALAEVLLTRRDEVLEAAAKEAAVEYTVRSSGAAAVANAVSELQGLIDLPEGQELSEGQIDGVLKSI